MTFRMYVDEVGNPGLKLVADPNHRYLSLTGAIFESEYSATVVAPALEQLKWCHFGSHPDEPICLHRKELVNKVPPFHVLRDTQAESQFNAALLSFLKDTKYVVISVAIDKQALLNQYKVWHFDPYHYCLKALVERYVLWLESRRGVGDVLAEGRGGNEDRRLKRSYEMLYSKGTEYVSASRLQTALTSCQLKVKRKENNIAGLQIVDLIAHPSYKAMVCQREGLQPPGKFGGQVECILKDGKYRCGPNGQIGGWGTKWLP